MRNKAPRAPWLRIAAFVILLELLAIGLTLFLGSVWRLPPAEKIDLGQLVVALLLIPPAIVAFWEASEALRQSAAQPLLGLAFLGEDGLLHHTDVINIPQSGGSANRVTLAVENTGDAIAVWWQAHFDIPVEMMRSLRSAQCTVNVMPRHVPVLTMDTVGEVERRVVQSAGTIGLFPGPPVQIATIEVHAGSELTGPLEQEYHIDYRLFTEQSNPVIGSLPLKIHVAPRK